MGNDLRQKYGAKNKNNKQSFMFNQLKKRAALCTNLKNQKPFKSFSRS